MKPFALSVFLLLSTNTQVRQEEVMNREVPVEFLQSLTPKALPAAPGHNWEDPFFRKHHAKPQSLEGEFTGKKFKVAKSSDLGSSRSNGELPSTITAPSARQIVSSLQAAVEGRSEELSRKTYATLEDKVLRYYAYFSEQVRESALETERHRLVTILFFPHDDTLLIQEPHLPNSGLQGGTILKRQRVVANPRQREAFPAYDHVCLDHISVGQVLVVNNISYTVYACDAATRFFLAELGLEVAPNSQPPQDNYATRLASMQETASSTNFGVKSQDRSLDDVIRTQRFIQDSGKVLLFKGIYDDRTDGNRVRLVDVLLYIEDDTVSLVERQVTGEQVPSGFLSRRKLPKDGKMEKTVELTFAHRVNGMRETNLGSPDAYYGPLDLGVGASINVYGRNIFLYDCDDFTRDYFETQFGMQLAEPIDVSGVVPSNAKQPRPTLPTPPYTGFGTHEDSLSSCKSLALKPPRGNVMDPHSRMDVLRFQMRLHNPERLEDRGRLFTLNYYVEDGESMVQEIALRNSGFTGGKFTRKHRLVKSFDGTNPVYYSLADFSAPGAVIRVNEFSFEVVTCDEHTSNYLANPERKGVSAEAAVKVSRERTLTLLTTLKGFLTVRYVTQTEAFRSFDRDKDGSVTLAEFFNGLKAQLITNLEEEAIALFHQIATSETMSHTDFFKWLAAPVAIRTEGPHVDTSSTAAILQASSNEGEKQRRSRKILKALKEKLEARCLNGFEMFRMCSTMPRAYKGRRADVQCLTNTDKDAYVTPVQLRRCVDEVLGLGFTENEMQLLLAFFFPNVPEDQLLRRADPGACDRIELKEFQAKFSIVSTIDQLKGEW